MAQHREEILLGTSVIELKDAAVVGSVAVKANVGRTEFGLAPRHDLGVAPGSVREIAVDQGLTT